MMIGLEPNRSAASEMMSVPTTAPMLNTRRKPSEEPVE